MTSAGSISHAASASQKRSTSRVRSSAARRRVAQRLLVRERLAAHALGEVGDRRDGGDAQAAVAGEDHLGHGRHADGVGAERAEGADLGRRLEARAVRGEVDALGQRDAEPPGALAQQRRAAPGRRRRAGSGSAGPTSSSLGPVSGLTPSMLMWSAIAISEPGRRLRAQRAGGVGGQQRAPRRRAAARAPARASRPGRRPRRRAGGPAGTRPGRPPSRPSTSRPPWPATPGSGKPGQVARRRSAIASSSGVGEPAEAGAEDQPEPRREAGRAARRSTAAAASPRATAGSMSCARALTAGTPGRRSAGSSSLERHLVRGRPARRAGARCASSGMNSRRRWRQPPHGTHGSSPSPITAASAICVAPGGDQRADRRRLRALALRVGGVLDVGADVDGAVGRAQRDADAVAASTARRRARSARARRPAISCLAARAAASSAVRVGVGQDPRRRRGRAPRSAARPGRARPEGRSPRARRPRARGSVPRPRDRSRWMRTPSHSSSRRSLSTTTSVPSAASSASRSAAGVLDGRDPVAALARLGPRRRGAYWISAAPPGRLLAQLQPAVGDAEVGVALDEHAAVLGAELEADRQRALGVGVGRLELHVAAGRGHRREPSGCPTR